MLKIGRDEYKIEDVLAIQFMEDQIKLVDSNHDIHMYTKEDVPDFKTEFKHCRGKLYKNTFVIDNQLIIKIMRIHSIVKIGTDKIRIRYGYRLHEEFEVIAKNELVRDKIYNYYNKQIKAFFRQPTRSESKQFDLVELTEQEFKMRG